MDEPRPKFGGKLFHKRRVFVVIGFVGAFVCATNILKGSSSSYWSHGFKVEPPFEEEDEEPEWPVFFSEDRLLYNRVPKCASTTLYSLLMRLAKFNKFRHVNSKNYAEKFLSHEEQERFVELVTMTSAPCSFDRHVFFINFAKFNSSFPVYINMIRDPVERVISSFYYRRVGATKNRHLNKTKPSAYWMNKTFESCVQKGDEECSYITGEARRSLITPFFCGQEKRCEVVNDRWALEKAKSNIIRYYSVVGVVEDFNVTLAVLENTIPQFFRGVVQMYNGLEMHKNRNPRKNSVSEEVKAMLRANLSSEYELYYFVRERLYNQFRNIQQYPER